jgi:hypothetical protein
VEAFARFDELWACDFEFSTGADLLPRPLCMTAREVRSGRIIQLWRNEFLGHRRAPFDVGPRSAFIAYSAQAELDCFIQLGWPLPVNVIDLYVEHLVSGNPTKTSERGLLHALAARGLEHAWHFGKDRMRQKAMSQVEWNERDRAEMLLYNREDVEADVRLFLTMAPSMNVARSLYYGRFIKSVALIYTRGIPVDAPLWRLMVENWERVKLHFIEREAAEFQIYEGTSLRHWKLAALAERLGIADTWPRTPTGRLATDVGTWAKMARACPALKPLTKLHGTITDLKLSDLPVASDERARCWLAPFWTSTGRSLPSPAEFIFAMPRWTRALIKPERGYGFAYVDFSTQEIAIAAGLSGDVAMREDILAGDVYLAFGKRAGLLPADATKETHGAVRDCLKVAFLGSNYGMTEFGLGAAVKIPLIQAREILARHRSRYRTFYRWRDDVVASAQFAGSIETPWGWCCRVDDKTAAPRFLMDFMMQAGGADMLRIAVIAGTDAGLPICATVHDAIALVAPLPELDDAVAQLRSLMARAGELICGLPVRTEVEVLVRWPDRYPTKEKSGRNTFADVCGVLRDLGERVA